MDAQQVKSQKSKSKNQKGGHFCVLTFAFCLLTFRSAHALRIVSLLPSNTEIVEALGAGDELVGVSSYDGVPKGSTRVNVGDLLNPQWEVLVSLHPDLVLAGHWSSAPAGERLKALHIPFIEVDHPQTLSALYDSITLIAGAIHVPQLQADRVIQTMQGQFNGFHQSHAARPLLPVYIEIDSPSWTIGGRDYLDDALRAIGLENIFHSMPRLALEASSESVIEKNPAVIISLQMKGNVIEGRPGWSEISAVRRHWIIDDVLADDLVRPSPRLIRGLQALDAHMRKFEHEK